jgi:hypothetical protein
MADTQEISIKLVFYFPYAIFTDGLLLLIRQRSKPSMQIHGGEASLPEDPQKWKAPSN